MKMYNPPHPGEVLKELYLDPLDLSITEVAHGLQVSRNSLSKIVNKKSGISLEMALKLGRAFGTTPESWMNSQQGYNLWNAEQNVDLSCVRVFYKPTNGLKNE